MKTEWLYKTFSLAIISILFYLFYNVISPFLSTIAWAMVLSITFYPAYRLILKYIKRPWAASILALMLILLIILGPFSLLLGTLVSDITDVYNSIEQKGFETLTDIKKYPRINSLIEKISSYKIFENFDLQESAVKSLKAVGQAIAGATKNVFKNAAVLLIQFIIMCVTIFFFFRDGNKLIDFIKKLLPFSETQKDRLEERVKEMVIAAIYGGLAVGVAQGTLGGIAFLIFGLPSPVFWGTAMAILSLVPLFGCFLVWGTAGIILLLAGSYAKGAGLLVYGVLIISSVDNIIKPLVIGGRTKLHMLLVLFSVLGGINYFGFVGFILGPLIAALCLSLLEIYTFEETEEQEAASP
jgi:predicted PurR-regulated permease PerM